MNLSHRIEIKPTKTQAQALTKACGTARFTWNWALAEIKSSLDKKEKPKFSDLKKRWNKEKPFWVYESPKGANQQPFAFLQKALNAFFRNKTRFPRFKSKGKSRDSFYVENDKMILDGRRIRLPKIGWVQMTELLRFEGRILSGTVSREADRWFVSIAMDVGDLKKKRTDNQVVGIDLGIKALATLSTGEQVDNPRHLQGELRLLKRRSRQHSRKRKGSNNRRKSALKLARLHRKIRNARKDTLHKLTVRLCRESQAVVIEDLNVKGMMANRRLSRAISDVGFFELRRQLEYKAKIWGTEVIIANRWFPSSKTCSGCGWKMKVLSLGDRTFKCKECGMEVDRDLNAAMNLRKLVMGPERNTVGLTGIDACGEEGSGLGRESKTKPCLAEAGTAQKAWIPSSSSFRKQEGN